MKRFFLFLFLFSQTAFSQYAITDAFPNLTFSNPVEMVTAGDGTNRLFVVEKGGIIRVFDNSPSVSNTKIFLNITDSTSQYTYAGLFGLAFHPNYQSNRYFYVYYLRGTATNLSLTLQRYTTSPTNPDSALRSSQMILLNADCPQSNHNGGSLHFGPDGYLYLTMGDSSPGSGGDPLNKAQNKAELFGKILRLNVDSSSGGNNYAIPHSNPFYGNSLGYREEIYAYGVRNPFKFSFDLTTGRLWLGDVGQTRSEEINIIENGKNYGWRVKEALDCYVPSTNCDTGTNVYTPPLFYYSHNASGGYSITGGYVYRGNFMPGLVGKYVYADYVNKKIWALTWDGTNTPTNEVLFGTTTYNIVSFAEDKDKNLYFLHFATPGGKVYKIYDSSINGIESINNGIPSSYRLYNNFPNPFNPTSKIRFDLPENSTVKIYVYDVTGKEINVLINGFYNAGTYSAYFNATDLPSGVYLCRMTVNETGFSETIKMAIVK